MFLNQKQGSSSRLFFSEKEIETITCHTTSTIRLIVFSQAKCVLVEKARTGYREVEARYIHFLYHGKPVQLGPKAFFANMAISIVATKEIVTLRENHNFLQQSEHAESKIGIQLSKLIER